jgi:hypothetical protein
LNTNNISRLAATFVTIRSTISFCFIPTAIASKLAEGCGLSWKNNIILDKERWERFPSGNTRNHFWKLILSSSGLLEENTHLDFKSTPTLQIKSKTTFPNQSNEDHILIFECRMYSSSCVKSCLKEQTNPFFFKEKKNN